MSRLHLRIPPELFLMFLLSILGSPQGWSQQPQSPPQPGGKQEKDPILPPERVLFDTRDKVELRAEWFPGKVSKETVPVILVHDWGSSRRDLLPLAKDLQTKYRFAVIVPDLRGHGESLTVIGSDEPLDQTRFKKIELASMVEDIDACRRFLQAKNDDQELNLNMLAVVAFGSMSIHAVDWCINDWQWLPIGGVQQGRNVKALVMVSPKRRFKSLNMAPGIKTPLFANPNSALQVFLIWGQQHETSHNESTFIFDQLSKSRRQDNQITDWDQRWQEHSIFQWSYNANAVATELLNQNAAAIADNIGVFLQRKIVDRKDDFPWQSRKRRER